MPKELIKGNLVLKTGQWLTVVLDPKRELTATSFTEYSLHAFERPGKSKIFVQGNNIAYLEIETEVRYEVFKG